MRVEPRLDEVINGERGMMVGIQVALHAQCLLSAVSLMFSTVDALAGLTRPVDAKETKPQHFVDWSDRYLHPTDNLGCNSTDLYAARCGVLHTYGYDSLLRREGKARRLVYKWRGGPEADESVPLPADTLVIEGEALHEAVCDGVHQFLIDSETHPDTRGLVQAHLGSMLCYAPWPKLEALIAA